MQFYVQEYGDLLEILKKGNARSDPYAIKRALTELSRLMLARDKNREEVVKSGVFRSMAEIVQDHIVSNPDVIVECCYFLRRSVSLRVPSELDIQSKITDTGYLKIIKESLERHSDNSDLFIEASKLISVMCFDVPLYPHVDNQMDIASAGILNIFCSRLATDPRLEETEVLLHAIFSLLYDNEDNVVASQRLDLLKCCSKILGRYPESSKVHTNIFKMLYHIIEANPDVRIDLMEFDFIERAIDFIERTPKIDVLTQWNVYKFLETFLRQMDEAKSTLDLCNGIQIISVAVLRAHGRNPKQSSCLFYLCNVLFCHFCVNDDPTVAEKDRVDSLIRSGGLQFIATGMKSYPDSLDILQQSVRLLDIIATLDSSRIPLTRLGASRLVKAASIHGNVNAGLQALCIRAIGSIEGT